MDVGDWNLGKKRSPGLLAEPPGSDPGGYHDVSRTIGHERLLL